LNNLPFRLKIAAFYFFLQGGLGMLFCIIVWFLPIKSIIIKIFLFIFIILYFILNIEVGKGLKELKKWSFIVAVIICFLEPLGVILGITKILPITILGLIVLILLLTVSKLFWNSEKEKSKQDIII